MLSDNITIVAGPKNGPKDSKKSAETVDQKESASMEDLSNPIINEQDQSQTVNTERGFYKESETNLAEQQTKVEKSAEKISESDHSEIIEGDDSVGDQNTIINP